MAFCLLPAGSASATHVQCGDVITQDTTLDSDLSNCPGNGVVIGAKGIRLNLAGHTIDGSGFPPGPSTGVDNTGGFDNVTIENGTITDFRYGVEFRNVDASTVIGIDVRETLGAIKLTFSAANVIERSTLTGNATGIQLSDGANRNTIARNMFVENDFGIFVLPLEGTVPPQPAEGDVIERNAFSGNGKAIDIPAGNLNSIDRNTIDSSSSLAIDVGSGSGNSITRNDIADNELGIRVAGQARDATVAQNAVIDSAQDGIVVGPIVQGVIVVESNVSSGNGDDGIDVDTTHALITKNTANDNVDLGIEAVPGVSDGGGNKARGNGNPLECLNVVCK
jgi:parallel beta-helix repeat protein